MGVIRTAFDNALRLRRITAKEAANMFGVGNQQITKKIHMAETISAKEYFRFMDLLGIDICLRYKDTKEEVPVTISPLNVQEVFRLVTNHYKLSMYAAARKCGFGEQSFVQKVTQRDSMRAKEFFEDMKKLDVSWSFVVRETGVELEKQVYDSRVIGTSDKKRFDTKDSTFLASSFYAGGKKFGSDGKAVDLYVDGDGDYFIAEHSENGESRIRTVPKHVADAIVHTYGKK